VEKENVQKKDLKTNKKVMPPDEYFRLLKGFDIKDIYLTSCNYSVDKNKFGSNPESSIDISLETNTSFKLEESKKGATFIVNNNLVGKNKNEDSNVIDIKTTYELYFISSEEINNEFLSIYSEISLPLNIFPYFREFMQNLTIRSGISPIVLPLARGFGKPFKMDSVQTKDNP